MWKVLFSWVGAGALFILIVGYFVLRLIRERKSKKKLEFSSRK